MDGVARKLPDGLFTELTHCEFSAGEKQMFCLARAIIHSSPIMLCDEITANVDSSTADAIHRLLLHHSRKETALFICHRLDHIRMFDIVIVMQDGRIVECGTPEALLGDMTSLLSGMLVASNTTLE